MDTFILFLRKNILLVIILLILGAGFIVFRNKPVTMSVVSPSFQESGRSSLGSPAMGGVAFQDKMTNEAALLPPMDSYAPQPSVTNRLVIQNSYLSLLVTDVKKVRDDILTFIQGTGGYMVSSDTNGGDESLSSTVTVRVPQTQLESVLSTFRSYAIRVVSEHLDGHDVTDQYVDIQKRITILEETMVQFEELRNRSQEISDLTNLTREILNMQSQIDNYKGQQESLEKNAEFAKVTVYLSTDEIALPYQPDDNFRPNVIFKLAVRSLMTTLRSGLSSLIWIAVYGVVWIPLLLICIFLYRKIRK